MTNDIPSSSASPALARSLLLEWDYRGRIVIFHVVAAPGDVAEAEPLDGHVSRWQQAVHPEDLPSVAESFDSHLRGHEMFHTAEYRLSSGPGTWQAVRDVALVTARDPFGAPLSLSLIRVLVPPGGGSDGAESDWQAVRRIGHDLNNLLGAISGYSEMLLEDVRPGAAMFADLDRVHEAAQRASVVAGTLMAITRRRTTPVPPGHGVS
jgi:hypothetical protein